MTPRLTPLRLHLVESIADIVQILLDFDGVCCVRDLIEATVRLPARGHVWIAVFTGPEPGRQLWRSTGLRDYDAALALAKTWEADARAQRLARKMGPRAAALRVRRRRHGKGPSPESGPLSQAEVAALLRMSERAVRQVEKRALAKLYAHPSLRKIWSDYLAGELEEALLGFKADHGVLNDSDVLVLFALAHTSFERKTICHILALVGFFGI